MSSDENDPVNKKKGDAFAAFAAGLLKTQADDRAKRQATLKEGITQRERQDMGIIKISRVVTAELSRIREEAGMSAFVGTSGKIVSPRVGRDDFLELLARELLYIGTKEMSKVGGLVSLKKLREYFTESRDNWELRDRDLEDAIKLLVHQELIPKVDQISDEQQLIHFRAIELSDDLSQILRYASSGLLSRAEIKVLLGWEDDRLDTALKKLEQDGVAIIDQDDIYFPGM